jgi:hypothetical protein
MTVVTDATVFSAIAAGLAAVSVGALLKAISIFTRHVDNKDSAFTTFLGNHMSANVKAMTDLTVTTQRLADGVDTLHDDNVTQANKLKLADSTVIRMVEEQNMSALTKRMDDLEKRNPAQ